MLTKEEIDFLNRFDRSGTIEEGEEWVAEKMVMFGFIDPIKGDLTYLGRDCLCLEIYSQSFIGRCFLYFDLYILDYAIAGLLLSGIAIITLWIMYFCK